MKKKVISLILCAGLVAAMLAGCGDEKPASTSTASSGSKTASASTSETKPSFDASKLKIAVCIGEVENEAGVIIKEAYEAKMREYGITDVTMVDAKYDAVTQSEQIEAAIQTKPDAIFIHPADPTGIAQAVQHVIDAGIPVFCNEGSVTGLEDQLTSQCRTDNYSEGYATMMYLAEKMGGKGKLGMCYLDSNANWHERDLGALAALKNYPDIEIVQEWSWDSTGVYTPRMAVDDMLTACPNVGDLTAVWSAWDGGALEGIQAAQAAGRTEILFAGTDGGEEACETILNGDQFVCSGGPMLYTQVTELVDNAIRYLQGEKIPQCVWSPNALLTKENLTAASKLLEDGQELADWQQPGMAEKWGITISATVSKDE